MTKESPAPTLKAELEIFSALLISSAGLGAGAFLHGISLSPCIQMIAGQSRMSLVTSFILLQPPSAHVFYPTKSSYPDSVFISAVWCPSWPCCAPSRGDLWVTESVEFHPEYMRGRQEGCSLHFKSWKHILGALLLSVLQFLRKTQLRKDFGRNPKLTFACLFQVMHMHACKTQALVVSASGLKAMAWTEIEAHLYKIAFKNSICQLHTLQRCRAWVVVRRWGCQPGTWAISLASQQVCSLSLGHFSFPSLFFHL